MYQRFQNRIHVYLDNVDPIGTSAARYRYSCFEHFGEDKVTAVRIEKDLNHLQRDQ